MVLISFFFYLSNLLQLILRKNICETSKMINWNFYENFWFSRYRVIILFLLLKFRSLRSNLSSRKSVEFHERNIGRGFVRNLCTLPTFYIHLDNEMKKVISMARFFIPFFKRILITMIFRLLYKYIEFIYVVIRLVYLCTN